MESQDCLFCRIAAGQEPASKVWENEQFLAFKNKFPVAPVHLLVIPKAHVGKKRLIDQGQAGYWEEMMGAVVSVIKDQGLDKKGYKLVNNGAGYNHFDHEHMHVLGGTKKEPQDTGL